MLEANIVNHSAVPQSIWQEAEEAFVGIRSGKAGVSGAGWWASQTLNPTLKSQISLPFLGFLIMGFFIGVCLKKRVCFFFFLGGGPGFCALAMKRA